LQPSEVADLAHWQSLHLWSKTPLTLQAMNEAVARNISARLSSSSSSRHHLISWSIPDPVATSSAPRHVDQPLQVLMIIGTPSPTFPSQTIFRF
jgi:hypothetical protein